DRLRGQGQGQPPRFRRVLAGPHSGGRGRRQQRDRPRAGPRGDSRRGSRSDRGNRVLPKRRARAEHRSSRYLRGSELSASAQPPTLLRYGSPAGRWVLLATVLGSGMALLDSTVVNVALPTIGRDFNTGLASLQWTVNAYTLTLAAFLLLGGSLGDHYGRRRIFEIGVIWFAIGSLLCGIAPSAGTLIAARAFQGIGAALLTPGSLAI